MRFARNYLIGNCRKPVYATASRRVNSYSFVRFDINYLDILCGIGYIETIIAKLCRFFGKAGKKETSVFTDRNKMEAYKCIRL